MIIIGALLITSALVIGSIALWAHVQVHRVRLRRSADYTLRFDDARSVRRIDQPDGGFYFADAREAPR